MHGASLNTASATRGRMSGANAFDLEPSRDPNLSSTSIGNLDLPAHTRPDTAVTESTLLPPSMRVHERQRRKPIPRKGHTKSRHGCLNCKRRRVKCPETLPACDHCQRLNLTCNYSQGHELEVLRHQSPSRRLSPVHLTMTDLHFFHHFLLHAYPSLPIQGEAVWMEAAQLSHGFEYLSHAMLGLGASHLGLWVGKDYYTEALTHRGRSINSLNAALSFPCRTAAEADARYATLMALTFQASYMEDGMLDFISLLRGCSLVAQNSLSSFEQSTFRRFSTQSHVQTILELNHGLPVGLDQPAAIDSGLASLNAIIQLSTSEFEVHLSRKLQEILELSRMSCVNAFVEICRAYRLFADSNTSDFQTMVDPDNHVVRIIICHFFVVELVLAAVALAPTSPAISFRHGIIHSWVHRVSSQAPAVLRPFAQWPVALISSFNAAECEARTIDTQSA